MKKLGLIGGVGPESSIEYYRLIIKRFQERLNTKEYPEMIINSINMTEMVFNKIIPDTKKQLIEFVHALKEKEAIQGLILGGTELPLILGQQDFVDLEILDTTKIHVEAVVAKMLED